VNQEDLELRHQKNASAGARPGWTASGGMKSAPYIWRGYPNAGLSQRKRKCPKMRKCSVANNRWSGRAFSTKVRNAVFGPLWKAVSAGLQGDRNDLELVPADAPDPNHVPHAGRNGGRGHHHGVPTPATSNWWRRSNAGQGV